MSAIIEIGPRLADTIFGVSIFMMIAIVGYGFFR